LHEEIEKAKARHDRVEDGIHPMLDAWKMHVAEMVKGAEDKVVPILEGGVVRILPVMGDAGIASGSGPTEMQAKHREGLKHEHGDGKDHKHHAHSHHSHSHGHHGHRKAHAFGDRYVSIYTQHIRLSHSPTLVALASSH
jgi:ABC-type Zn2+ transport system substrate-binding protein/surface adhesin